jgi:enoyl-CoA hydratase
MPATLDLARQIVANTPFGVRATKQVVRTNLGAASLEHGIELENRNQALAAGTRDMREALAAYLERRRPVYVGD